MRNIVDNKESNIQPMDEIVNYELSNSSSNNYQNYSSSSPQSFPDFMQNGILIDYDYPQYSVEVISEE